MPLALYGYFIGNLPFQQRVDDDSRKLEELAAAAADLFEEDNDVEDEGGVFKMPYQITFGSVIFPPHCPMENSPFHKNLYFQMKYWIQNIYVGRR